MHCSTASAGSATSRARPTATASATQRCSIALVSSVSRKQPIGRRVIQVMLLRADNITNFIQISTSTSSDKVAVVPASLQALTSAIPRADRVPSCSPTVIKLNVPVWVITPGSLITEAPPPVPPMT